MYYGGQLGRDLHRVKTSHIEGGEGTQLLPPIRGLSLSQNVMLTQLHVRDIIESHSLVTCLL